jgi:hypothetical protein
MDSIINLRRARKRKAQPRKRRPTGSSQAGARAEREVTDRIHAIEDRRLNAHLRQVRAADDGE